jgi:membrane protein YdbS with pleckstrin-like domain
VASYPESLLRPGERVHEHLRPHWRMLVVPALLPPLLAAPTGFVAAMVSAASWRTVVWVALAVLVGGLLWWFSLAPLARWRCTHLVVTDRRLLVREGVVSRSGIEIAAQDVVAVRVRQTVLERLLGCGTLVVVTLDAGEDGPWELDGIPQLARVAATLDEVAEDCGGLVPRDAGVGADLDPDDRDDRDPDDRDPDDRDRDRRTHPRRPGGRDPAPGRGGDVDPAPAPRRGDLALRPRGHVVRTSR